MSEYTNNNFENREQMYQYNTQNNGYQMMPEAPNPGKRGSKGKAARTLKKAGAIVLSAVLFGGVAAGTFQAVNHVTGYSPAIASSAASAEANAETTQTTEPQSVLQTTAISGTDATITGSLDVSDITESVMPSIVAITNRSVQEVRNYFSMFGYGGQTQLQETESAGSGFIIGKNAEELLLVTNYHVIENADTLSACFIDNEAYEANVKGTDPDNDLAVLAIPLENISDETMAQIRVAAIGDSDALKVGEQVVAIGNALGYGQSVTTGIVSAKNRTISTGSTANVSESDEDAPTYIQTDAAINPGNSGGALVNMNGEVVGINSAKIASSSVEGMGYAIPVSRVSDIIETLMNETTRTKVADEQKASIGITGITVDSTVSKTYGIPAGAYIASVSEGSAAEAAGLEKGEVITKFDGKTVSGIEELKELLQYYAAGETVEVTVKVPGSGEYAEKTVSLTLGRVAETSETTKSGETDPTSPDFSIHW